MGYTTDFSGQFKLNKPLDDKTKEFLTKFAETRRMKRDPKKIAQQFGGTPEQYGVEGEFFVGGLGFAGQNDDASVLEHNYPPITQPGLWCQWAPNEDGTAIVWDGGEKFYDYVAWLEYIVKNFLMPKGYSITGDVIWQGEDTGDVGVISVKANKIAVYQGRTTVPKTKTKKPKAKTETKVERPPKDVKLLGNTKGEKFIELRELVDFIQWQADGLTKDRRATLLVLIDKIKDLAL
jgi:hypothetical protein